MWLAALRRGVGIASLYRDINNASTRICSHERLGYVAVERQAAYRIDFHHIDREGLHHS